MMIWRVYYSKTWRFYEIFQKRLHLGGGNSQFFKNHLTSEVATKRTKKDVKKRKKNNRSKVETRKKFECNQCAKVYITRGHLNRHINDVHEKIKLFSCKQCDGSFTRSDQLKDHVNFVHLKQKLHKCPGCENFFCQERTSKCSHLNSSWRKQAPHLPRVWKELWREKESYPTHENPF